jgi:hypothetical protein
MGTVYSEITLKNAGDVIKALEGLIPEQLTGAHGDEIIYLAKAVRPGF